MLAPIFMTMFAAAAAASITPASGVFYLTATSPTVSFAAAGSVAPANGAITTTAGSPTIASTPPAFSIAPASGAIGITTTLPTLTFTPAGVVAPNSATITTTATSPTITATVPNFAFAPASGGISLTATSPTILFVPMASLTPASATIAITGGSPVISFEAGTFSVSPASSFIGIRGGEVEIIDEATANAELLRSIFPAFAAVPDATISFWLMRAARVVDASWTDGDRIFAQMLLAAHLMTDAGIGTSALPDVAAGFKVMRSGSLTLERFDGATSSGYGSTTYGRQFAILLRQNRGGARITGIDTLDGVFGTARLPSW